MVGGQVRRGWQHTLFGHDSTTEAGLAVRRDHIDVGLVHTEARAPLATVSNDRVGETEAGAWVQNTATWLPWFRTLLGLREDRIFMDTRYLQTATTGHATGSRLSPKASLVFGPWAKTEFFANAGRGFHSNDARGVAGTVGTADAVPALVASKGEELGLRTEIVPGLQTSLALWRLDSDSELVYTADEGGTEPNGASRRHGIELNNHLVLNRWLLVDADMAWTHARYADANANGDAGNYISNAVSRSACWASRCTSWARGRRAWSHASSGLSAVADGASRTPSSIVTNLQVTRAITPRVSLQVDVLNLFDRKFYDIAYQQDYRVSPAAATNPAGVTVHPASRARSGWG